MPSKVMGDNQRRQLKQTFQSKSLVKKDHLSSDLPFYKKLNLIHCFVVFGFPLISLYGLITTPIQFETAILFVLLAYPAGFAITAGYHRYFSHRSYKCHFMLELLFLVQ